jgi:uncharacterized protein YuzE
VRVTYDADADADADAAYVYLVNAIAAGEVSRTISVDFEQAGGMINLDLDHEGRVLGIEFIDGSVLLRAETLDEAR